MTPITTTSEDRLSTELSYKTVNSAGQVTIEATVKVNDQSQQSASQLLLLLINALSEVPKTQV